MVASNVGELIALLSSMDKSARIYTTEPPFDGVKLVPQNDGAVLVCRPGEPESKSQPAVSK